MGTKRRQAFVVVPEDGPKTCSTAWLLSSRGEWVEIDAPWKSGDPSAWVHRNSDGVPVESRFFGPGLGLKLDVYRHRCGVELSNTFATLIGVITGGRRREIASSGVVPDRFVFLMQGLPGFLAAVRWFESIRKPENVTVMRGTDD